MYWLTFVLTFCIVLIAGAMAFFYDKQIDKKAAAYEEQISELYRIVNKIIAKRGIINIENEGTSDIPLAILRDDAASYVVSATYSGCTVSIRTDTNWNTISCSETIAEVETLERKYNFWKVTSICFTAAFVILAIFDFCLYLVLYFYFM